MSLHSLLLFQLALVFNQLSKEYIRSITVIDAAKTGSVHRSGDEMSRDHLRTAPLFDTAHTFRASRDFLIQRYFARIVNKAGENPKRKLEVSTHFQR